MKILVTGSEGSLMQWVIPVLLKNGHSVLGVDNFARYGEIERQRNYDFIRGDLTDEEFVWENKKVLAVHWTDRLPSKLLMNYYKFSY